jgi:hypothetical protein
MDIYIHIYQCFLPQRIQIQGNVASSASSAAAARGGGGGGAASGDQQEIRELQRAKKQVRACVVFISDDKSDEERGG